MDQAASLAIDPNTDNLVVLNFASNELDLLTDEAILRQTKFISQQDQFSGPPHQLVKNVHMNPHGAAEINAGLFYKSWDALVISLLEN